MNVPRQHATPTCTKIRYESRKAANTALTTLMRRRAVTSGIFNTPLKLECRSYQCEICGHWHLTSTPMMPG